MNYHLMIMRGNRMLKQILNTFLNVEKEAEKNNKMVLRYNEKYHHKNEIKNAEMLLRRLGL